MKKSLKSFFERHPALLFALFFLFGTLLYFGMYSTLFPLFLLLWCMERKRQLFLPLVSLLAFALCMALYTLPERGYEGKGVIEIVQVREGKNGRGWVYGCLLKEFIPNGEKRSVATRLPCTLYSPVAKELGYFYHIEGKLLPLSRHYASLKTKKGWEKGNRHFTLLPFRFSAKKWVEEYFKKNIAKKEAASFLAALATGRLKDPFLFKKFEKRGVTHLLAISGFHFALIGLTFHFLFRLFLPFKINAACVIVLLTLYFFFIGPAPSVQRAWVMATIALVGLIVEKRGTGANSLGCALLAGLLFNPLAVLQAGFQLSFLATAGILFLFSPLEGLLRPLFPKMGNPLMDFFREGVALVWAVHIALVPHLLFTFHAFPLQGIFYNLFFPFLVTVAMILMLVASLFHLLFPPLGLLLHSCNGWYTTCILDLLDWPLIPFKTWYVGEFPAFFLTLYLTFLFGGAIHVREYRKRKRDDPRLQFHFL